MHDYCQICTWPSWRHKEQDHTYQSHLEASASDRA